MTLLEALKSNRPIKRKGWKEYVKFDESEVFQVYQIVAQDWEVQPIYLKATVTQIKNCLEKAYIKNIMSEYGFTQVILDKFKTRCKVERDVLVFTEKEALQIVLSVMGNKADTISGGSDRFIENIEELQIC